MRMIENPSMRSVQGAAERSMVPGCTHHENSTSPFTPSTRRASSAQGRRPAIPVTIASVTVATPVAVVNVVSSTLVRGM